MKHLVITLTVLSLVATAVGFTAFHTAGDADVKAALEQRDAMAWLRTEFSLTDPQYQRIKTLHDSYSLECADHCRAIQEAEQTRDALKAAGADPARLAEANRTLQHLELVCETAIAAQVWITPRSAGVQPRLHAPFACTTRPAPSALRAAESTRSAMWSALMSTTESAVPS